MVHDRYICICKRERNALVAIRWDAGQTQECSVGLQMSKLHLDRHRKDGNCWLACIGWLQACPGDRCFEKEHGDVAAWRIADRYTHRNTVGHCSWGHSGGTHRAATSNQENSTH